jgi:Mg-chelatase subunit ChlD
MSKGSGRLAVIALIFIFVLGACTAAVWRTGMWRTLVARYASTHTTPPPSAPNGGPTSATPKGADTPVPANATTPPPAPSVSHAIVAAETVTGEDIGLDSAGATIELVSNGYGAGPDGLKLLDGNPETSWTSSRDFFPATLPLDIVLSFYKRQPALIQAVTIALSSEPDTVAPKDVEVWTSATSAADGFVQVAAAPLTAEPKRQAITFAPIEARFVKLRIASLQKPLEPRTVVALGGIGVIEVSRSGYVRLAERNPDVADWVGSPRRAAQRGINWLEPAVVKWQKSNECFGCHIQSQALMGLTIASRNDYAVSEKTIKALADYTVSQQKPDGTYVREPNEPSTLFGGMGLAYYDDWQHVQKNPALLKTADYLVGRLKPTGEIPNGDPACGPHTVVQGPLMATVNTLVALHRAYDETQDARYKDAADRAFAWVASAPAKTTQDQVFKVLALTRYGGPSAKADVQGIVENLILQQQPSGGWRECPTETYQKDANPFSTGQVLYGFKQAGVSIGSSPFLKGVKYLLDTQRADGAWPADSGAMHTMGAAYAPTMWAVIGLAGSFGAVKAGGLQITAEQTPEQTAARRNLEIILDASGSMKAALGKSTRIATARQVLKDLLAKLPDDFNVGLRVYARRFSAKQKETCTDTELLRPIAKLDRQQIASMVDGIVPRGETPLVYSILQAPADLKAAGGGSLIVITDGEETCGGDPVKAAQQLKDAGMPITLNIVGFTLTGKKVEQQLSQFAEATGGHYYSAQDGAALTRALGRAALTRFPYTIFDSKGTQVAAGLAGPLMETLPPGDYRIVVQAGDSEITTNVTLAANDEVIMRIVDRGDRFELVRKGG